MIVYQKGKLYSDQWAYHKLVNLMDIEQNSVYPELPEADVFDDVLMFNMFCTEWKLQSTFFILIVFLPIVLV
jgi:hypothetical protein